MKELLRSNDMVLISFVEALLRDAGIRYQLLDGHMSVVEGTLGILPRRIMVAVEAADKARHLMANAGLSGETLEPDKEP